MNAPPYPLFFRFSRSSMPQCHDTCRTFLPQCRSVFLPQCLVVVSSCRNACRSVLPLCLAACVRSVFRRVFPQRLPYCLAVVSYRSVLSQCLAVCSTAPAALPCCRFGDSCLEMQVASARKGGSRPDAVTGWSTCVCAHIFSFHSRLSSLPGEEVLKASAHASPNEHKKNLANFLFRRCLLPSFEILGLYGI